MSYQSFLEKASTCFLPLPFLPLERRLFFPCTPTSHQVSRCYMYHLCESNCHKINR